MALQWQFARFDDLPIRDWYTVSAARIDVFVMEQNCPFQDNDGADFFSWHLLGWNEEKNKRELAAYCRLVDPGVKFPEPSIGRVVTPRAFRGCGYGKLLMKEALLRHDDLYPSLSNKIGAQQRLEKFYGELGFVTASEIYIEDGIPHVEMVRYLAKDEVGQLQTAK
jgi:ElaA protein